MKHLLAHSVLSSPVCLCKINLFDMKLICTLQHVHLTGQVDSFLLLRKSQGSEELC